MDTQEKRIAIIGGIAGAGVLVLLLLKRSGVITADGGINLQPGSFTGATTNIGGSKDVFNVGAPGAVSFTNVFNSPPPPPGSADGAVAPCNCPDAGTVYYGNTTDQAASPSAADLLASLGATLDKILPAGVAAQGYYPGKTLLAKRISAYHDQQALLQGGISSAFAAMNLG